MRASDLKTLYNIEEQIEDALLGVFKTAFGTEAVVTVGDPSAGRELPRCNIYASGLEALDEGLLEIDGLGDEYLRHVCNLEIQIETDNSQEEQTRAFHNLLVGRARALLLRNTIGIDATNLPFLSVEEIRLTDSDRRVDGDVTASSSLYSLRLSIRADSWPTNSGLVG